MKKFFTKNNILKIFTLCYLGLLLFTFGESLVPGAQSKEQSVIVAEAIIKVTDPDLQDSSVNPPSTDTDYPPTDTKTIEEFYLTVRKSIGHFGLFFAIGLFGYFTFLRLNNKKLRYLFLYCSGIVAAVVAEILQLPAFTDGRVCTVQDMLINVSGYFIGTTILVIAGIIFSLLVYRKRSNISQIY